jgi:plasmid stabilization system protein ParE
MAKLRWSRQAADDLEEMCEYIAQDSPRYAALFAQSVFTILEAMSKERLPGSMVPEYQREDIRERLLHRCRIIVRVQKKQRVLEVARIIHGARVLPPLEE